VGLVGADMQVQQLEELCQQSGIDLQGIIRDVQQQTILKERIIGMHQQLLRIDTDSHWLRCALTRKDAQVQVEKSVHYVDAIIIEDYAKGPMALK
jgi:bifunctional ADP-heptose synthase (sugar kinase/adenylyltransferase)